MRKGKKSVGVVGDGSGGIAHLANGLLLFTVVSKFFPECVYLVPSFVIKFKLICLLFFLQPNYKQN